MAQAGLVDEVRGILARGYDENLKPLQSVGYKQVVAFIRGRYGWEQTLDMINRATWQYAKRQMTWFSADDAILWFGPDEQEEIKNKIESFYTGR
mgnify:FL=1